MILSTTWKHFFAARESNDSGNKNPMAYWSAWSDPDTNFQAKLNLLTNDPGTAILAGNQDNGIMILHSFKNLGGSILAPNDKYVCLLGTARTAPIIIVNEITIANTCNITTPSPEDLLACTDEEDLLDLHPPLAEENDDTITYSGGTTFLPPPWLLKTIIDAHTDDPFKIILAAKEGAEKFNESQSDIDPLYVPNTAATLENLVTWAWGIKRNLIPHTEYFLDPYDEEADEYQALRHQQCIQPANPSTAANLPPPPTGTQLPPGLPPVFTIPPPTAPGGNGTLPQGNDAILQQLAVSITRQSEEAATHNELFARQLEHSLEKEDKKKDRLKKFHSSIKQLILFASADDSESTPEDILESCKRVFNAETIVNAEQELALQFGNMGMQDASFAPGFVSALYSGKFLWNKNFTPSNFSPFMICEAAPLLPSNNHTRRLTLHLEDTNGKTSDNISSGSKNSVKAPTTYHEMFQQLKFFYGACSIFFGDTSIACSSLHALIQVVEKNKHIFKTAEVDTEFMSKFLLAIDKRFQLWLDSCMTSHTRQDIDDGILNFLPLIDSVRYGIFDLRLPLTFKLSDAESPDDPKNNKRGGGGGQGDAATGNPQKKKKQKGEPRIENAHQPEQFKMKTGETWASNFANKNVQSRVPWGDGNTKMCPRWFIAGFCFDNCYHKNSHVKSDEVPPEKLTAFKTFLDNIRGSN